MAYRFSNTCPEFGSLLRDQNEVDTIEHRNDVASVGPSRAAGKEMMKTSLHCPKCGAQFAHEMKDNDTTAATLLGAGAGAVLGSQTGVALLGGAISGVLPGAVLFALAGRALARKRMAPTCPCCGTSFNLS